MAGVYHMVGTVMLCGLANHLINYWLLEERKKEQTRVLFFITLTSIGPQWLTQKQTPLLVPSGTSSTKVFCYMVIGLK
jgi:hypothetical protein